MLTMASKLSVMASHATARDVTVVLCCVQGAAEQFYVLLLLSSTSFVIQNCTHMSALLRPERLSFEPQYCVTIHGRPCVVD